jgi:hypothetical protein
VWGEGEGKWWAEMERNRLIRGGMIIWTAWAAVNWFLGARVVRNGIYHRDMHGQVETDNITCLTDFGASRILHPPGPIANTQRVPTAPSQIAVPPASSNHRIPRCFWIATRRLRRGPYRSRDQHRRRRAIHAVLAQAVAQGQMGHF